MQGSLLCRQHVLDKDQLQAANQSVVKKTILIVIGMFAFGFIALPALYTLICNSFGLNGQVEQVLVAKASSIEIDKSRKVRVTFNSITNTRLPWSFKPETKELTLHPGELKKVNFIAQNLSGDDVVGQAIYSVTPVEAARYFKKTECFCFTQQKLKSGETKKMPVLFLIEPDLPKNIGEVTLSYTFFRADKYATK